MKWRPTEFRRPRNDVREVSEAKRTTQFGISRSSKRQAKIFSVSFMRTETVSLTICGDFTTWLSISVGFRGPFSRNVHGRKSAAKAKERSLRKSMGQSSLQKKTRSAEPTMNCFTKPVPRKAMEQISRQKISIGGTACSFIVARNWDRFPSRVG